MSYTVWKDWTPDFIRDMGDQYTMYRFGVWMPTLFITVIAFFASIVAVDAENASPWWFITAVIAVMPASLIELIHFRLGRQVTFRNSYASNFYRRYQAVPEHYKRDLAPLADRVFNDARHFDNWSSREDIKTFGDALEQIESFEANATNPARERAKDLIAAIQHMKEHS